MMKGMIALAAALVAIQAQAAQPAATSHTVLKDCVIQEVLPGKDMTGAFVRFVHQGAPVEMLRAEVPGVSERIELHSMAVKDGVMEMIPLTNPRLEAGERVFKKGADHVMLFDIKDKPAIGSRHMIRIYFSNQTMASCEAVVKSLQDVMKDAGIKGAVQGGMPKPGH
ncbi:MAG: copper chaperone PCu(A)C [Lautropia sp.]|nr:copper chaperone PCu(A)C [Lautropia sp.]